MRFDNFISLGWYCGVAASMEKIGIRTRSGPFDWCFSDFESVLYCIENEFEDMLDYKELVEVEGKMLTILQKKHGFLFNHEISIPGTLELKYTDILKKYKRRFAEFDTMVQNPTCFIRCIRNESELDYIAKNKEYIVKIIKKENIHSEILYIVSEELKEKADFLKPFIIRNYDGSSYEALRNMFEQNGNQIKEYCLEHSNIDRETYLVNKIFAAEKQADIKEELLSIYRQRYKIAEQLLRASRKGFTGTTGHMELSKGIMIYGANGLGKSFYHTLLKSSKKIKIIGFIDKLSKEKAYENVPIAKLQEAKKMFSDSEEVMIIVMPMWDMEKIKKEVEIVFNRKKYRILSIKEFLDTYNLEN